MLAHLLFSNLTSSHCIASHRISSNLDHVSHTLLALAGELGFVSHFQTPYRMYAMASGKFQPSIQVSDREVFLEEEAKIMRPQVEDPKLVWLPSQPKERERSMRSKKKMDLPHVYLAKRRLVLMVVAPRARPFGCKSATHPSTPTHLSPPQRARAHDCKKQGSNSEGASEGAGERGEDQVGERKGEGRNGPGITLRGQKSGDRAWRGQRDRPGQRLGRASGRSHGSGSPDFRVE